MDIINYNIGWMVYNAWLAVLPVLFIQLSLILKQRLLKFFFLLLWFFYVPNTIYLLTDLTHFIEQWGKLPNNEEIIVFMQYVTLETIGISSFFFSLMAFASLVRHSIWKKQKVKILIALNFLIGFALVLGKINRVNSWEVITDPIHFLTSSLSVLSSPSLLILSFLFGCFTNLLFFLMEDIMRRRKKVH